MSDSEALAAPEPTAQPAEGEDDWRLSLEIHREGERLFARIKAGQATFAAFAAFAGAPAVESVLDVVEEPSPQICDRCGVEMYDFQQWGGVLRTCLTCSTHINAVNAAMLVCPGCLDGLVLVDAEASGTKAHHPNPTGVGGLLPCHALGIRIYYGLGDGALTDWISDELPEPKR